MRARWTGYFCYDDLKIAVKLYPVTKKPAPLLRPVCSACQSELGWAQVCSQHGPISAGEVAHAYFLRNGERILVEPDELATIYTRADRDFTIRQFIPKAMLDPTDFVRSYFARPSAKHERHYAVLRESLRSAGLYGIGTLCLQIQQRPAAVWVKQQIIILSTLSLNHEKRDLPEWQNPNGAASTVTQQDIFKYRDRMRASSACLKPLLREDRLSEQIIDLLGAKIVRIASDNQLAFRLPLAEPVSLAEALGAQK